MFPAAALLLAVAAVSPIGTRRPGPVQTDRDRNVKHHACEESGARAETGPGGGRGHSRQSTFPEDASLSSLAAVGPWGHSVYAMVAPLVSAALPRRPRSTLTRQKSLRQVLPLVQSTVKPLTFEISFRKCAQVNSGKEFPQVTIFLLINHTGPPGASNLSQVSIRDAVSGIDILHTSGKMQERGFQTYTADSLPAGSLYVAMYTASIRGNRNETLFLPAYLTFSNASQNDVNLFGPVEANFTLRVNSSENIYPNHAVHFAAFVGAFLLSTLLLTLGFSGGGLMYARRQTSLRQLRKQGELNAVSDSQDDMSSISQSAKEEAVFEDKVVDIMVLEDPQNMFRALEGLHMSNLLRSASAMEASRVQMYKDLIGALLSGVRARGQLAAPAERRLLGVLRGQLQGMEGKLQEGHVGRMATLAAQCNLETQDEVEAQHCGQAAEKAQAKQLFQYAEHQEVLEFSLLLEKLHKLEQRWLQCHLLARHEYTSAQLQRQLVEQRRVELHKVFSEELEEVGRMGELEKEVADDVLRSYFTYQDQMEEVLDVLQAHQRAVLGERHAQRGFLVQSLQSLDVLVSDVFTAVSEQTEKYFTELHCDGAVWTEQLELLREKSKQDVVQVRQGLDETLRQERSALHHQLLKTRRSLISDKLREQKQAQHELSALVRDSEESVDPAQHLHRWQNLLANQSLELGELINRLDEEAAADIRKVTMHMIHVVMPELKGIPAATAQTLLSLGVPRGLLQGEVGAGVVTQAQEKLHSQGKAAASRLKEARHQLQEQREQELQKQRDLRTHTAAFFRSLCASQLILSDAEVLCTKLEFQKLQSQVDLCLVLPWATARFRMQLQLAQWRKEALREASTTVPSRRTTAEMFNAPSAEARKLFMKKLEHRLQLFEQEKEVESTVMQKVLEEVEWEREEVLLAQEEGLAVQLAALQYDRAEKRTRVLETHAVLLRLQTMLVEEMRNRGMQGAAEMEESIRNHSLGLEEAETHMQHKRMAAEELANSDWKKEWNEKERELFQASSDCKASRILREALHKREQLIGWLDESCGEEEIQAVAGVRVQLELKSLYRKCQQEVAFVCELVRRCQLPVAVLHQVLRLLLPSLPEGEMLSLTDALCPKPPPENGPKRWTGGQKTSVLGLLRGDVIRKNQAVCSLGERILKRRQNLLEKLFSSPTDSAGDVLQVLNPEGPALVTVVQSSTEAPPTLAAPTENPRDESGGRDDQEFSVELPSSGGRVFTFRCPPPDAQSGVNRTVRKKKKKRNFLNFKKSSVNPMNPV
ncbi:limbin-like isoform X2 [Denticeps clupeoides]|uniref:limbin-like isoform X2 n=1 Tax=Denticeps clupeoides TaxID=299321 RepID=UPI0010A2C093|nr:limbin isoform X2 [Denticeps clupeoides]